MGLPTSVCAQSAVERVAPLKVLQNDQELLVHEIYASIQGESTHAGRPLRFCAVNGVSPAVHLLRYRARVL